MDLQLFLTLLFAVGGGAIAGFAASLATKATTLGTQSAAFVTSTVDHVVPAGLRPFVLAELQALAGSPEMSAASVTGVASAILAKTGTMFPTALRADVIEILANYVKAFDSGLTNIAPTTTVLSKPPA